MNNRGGGWKKKTGTYKNEIKENDIPAVTVGRVDDASLVKTEGCSKAVKFDDTVGGSENKGGEIGDKVVGGASTVFSLLEGVVVDWDAVDDGGFCSSSSSIFLVEGGRGGGQTKEKEAEERKKKKGDKSRIGKEKERKEKRKCGNAETQKRR